MARRPTAPGGDANATALPTPPDRSRAPSAVGNDRGDDLAAETPRTGMPVTEAGR